MNKTIIHQFNSEQELVAACQKANAIAQKALYQQYAKTLMLQCLRYVGNEEDAKELLTDSFVSAFKKIEQFEYRGEGSTLAWLKKIAVNECLMYLRKRALQFSELQEDFKETNGDDEIVAEISAKEIMKLIHSLPIGYRTVFNLYVFENLKHNEIAEMLGISENTSKSQLRKARLLLQKQLMTESKTFL